MYHLAVNDGYSNESHQEEAHLILQENSFAMAMAMAMENSEVAMNKLQNSSLRGNFQQNLALNIHFQRKVFVRMEMEDLELAFCNLNL